MGVVGVICLLLAVGLFGWSGLSVRKDQVKLTQHSGNPKCAVLVPARDESAVIAGLLKSLKDQTYDIKMPDVYVIIETRDDPTMEICAKYGASVILRKDLSKQRKGYALDDAVKEILSKRSSYDLYFVLDADNLLESDFIARMILNYQNGYQIATGYRNAKNGDVNIITAASSLTFAMINGIGNRRRLREYANIIFSGTGLYVDGVLVEGWGGWPFHSLTEDYELSLYATLHNLPTYYDETAVFYDEQPLKYRQSVMQRVRWIKGYFDARKKYIPLMRRKRRVANYGSLVKEIVGVKPVILLIMGLMLLTLDIVLWAFFTSKTWLVILALLGFMSIVYFGLLILTWVILAREKIKFSSGMKLKLLLFNPFYLITYVSCALKALLQKDVDWVKIRHGD